MSSKSDNFKTTIYHEIHVFAGSSSTTAVPKSLTEGNISVDKKGFYVGRGANWTIRWKDIKDVHFDGRRSLIIKYNCDNDYNRNNHKQLREIECHENSSDDFHAFQAFAQKHWNRTRGKREQAATKTTPVVVNETSAAQQHNKVRKRKEYGRRQRRTYEKKPRMTTFAPRLSSSHYYSSDEDGDADASAKHSWTLPKESGVNVRSPPHNADEENNGENDLSMNVEKSTKDNAEHDRLDDKEYKRKRIKAKRRLQKKIFDDEDDSDDDLFDPDAAAPLTTPASKRLVSPANQEEDNANDDNNNVNDENSPPPADDNVVHSPSATSKGSRSIKSFFAPAPTKETSKPVVASHVIGNNNKSESHSAFSKKPMPTTPKKPLKADHHQWIDRTPPPPPPSSASVRRKTYRTPAARQVDDSSSDVDGVGSSSTRRPRPFNMMNSEVLLATSSSKRRSNAEDTDDDDTIIEESPTTSPLRRPTSGVDRSRSRFWSKRPRTAKSPMGRRLISPTLSSADAVLNVHMASTRKSKTVRAQNPYAYNRENRKPIDVSRPQSLWRGLRNLGNTCYLNASLQMLYTVPTFLKSLAGKGKDLTNSVVSVSEEVNDTSMIHATAANPSIVKKAIDQVTDKFEGFEQRDAHEFLGDLVDRIHDELKDEQKESGTPTMPHDELKEEQKDSGIAVSRETSHDELKEEQKESGIEVKREMSPFPTDEFFRMNVRVCLTCDSCGYARTMEEFYRHLSIDVENENKPTSHDSLHDDEPSLWSVQKGIDQFFAPEKREIKCEKCKDGTTATQTLQIMSRPKALLLHLKRFVLVEKPKLEVMLPDVNEDSPKGDEESKLTTAVEMAIRKNKAPVVLDETVSLGPILPNDDDKENSDNDDDRMASYDVSSVVHHIGSTAWSGHYTCDAIRKGTSDSTNTANWVSFDDGVTSATTGNTVLKSERSQKTAYMLLYNLHH